MEEIDLGYVAFAAYVASRDKEAVEGEIHDEWLQLHSSQREAWRASADCVKMFLEAKGARS